MNSILTLYIFFIVTFIALGVYLGIDEMANMIRKVNPHIHIVALADSGYFLDYENEGIWDLNLKHKTSIADEAIVQGKLSYGTAMRHVFDFMNISAGVHRNCLLSNRETNISNCIFAKYLTPHIHTPIFSTQVLYI